MVVVFGSVVGSSVVGAIVGAVVGTVVGCVVVGGGVGPVETVKVTVGCVLDAV